MFSLDTIDLVVCILLPHLKVKTLINRSVLELVSELGLGIYLSNSKKKKWFAPSFPLLLFLLSRSCWLLVLLLQLMLESPSSVWDLRETMNW